MENKNWTGNSNSIYKTLGASNHTDKDREENDYYATDPIAAELLLENEELNTIWECSCGEGHLAEVFKKYNKLGCASDLVDRGYGIMRDLDFLKDKIDWHGDIVTNPPYKYAQAFIERAIDNVHEGRKVCMFLKLQFMESKGRKELFKKYPPKTIYVSSSRILCAKNGKFDEMKKAGGSAVAYAWYVWEKGHTGETIVKWIN
jgi:hypothetical protein